MSFESHHPEDGEDNPNVYRTIGKQLRLYRQRKSLTQADVAGLIGISPQQYQKYEDAQSKCNLNYLVKLAGFYDIPLGALIGGEHGQSALIEQKTATEAELLARLVNAFVKLASNEEKVGFVKLVEAIVETDSP